MLKLERQGTHFQSTYTYTTLTAHWTAEIERSSLRYAQIETKCASSESHPPHRSHTKRNRNRKINHTNVNV